MVGLNQILKCQTSRSHYGSKTAAVTITAFKYRNKIGKIVVKTVPYSVMEMCVFWGHRGSSCIAHLTNNKNIDIKFSVHDAFQE
jgi:hypothetical protein